MKCFSMKETKFKYFRTAYPDTSCFNQATLKINGTVYLIKCFLFCVILCQLAHKPTSAQKEHQKIQSDEYTLILFGDKRSTSFGVSKMF